jgi:hypothetical protein
MYTCRVTTKDDKEGYSLTSNVYLDVYGKIFKVDYVISRMKYYLLGPPEYVEPYESEYVLIPIKRNIENLVRCSIYGNPLPDYQWSFGDIKMIKEEEIVSDRIDYIITPNKNDPPGSNQTVTCIAKNNRGTKRQVFTLQIIN